ncbi:chondroitin sulfate N-acetylgalactosaminyltransferase 2 [Lingula anatina]|uniref:Hexosyltransferase n=1 Tax=Lingula anatina TaxID=7574 RepID=A0A1S3IWG6_LINAN|nr:chondroitin sulfate N-acetylgalactosaminyltransferase 2 [Lingula anatina]XP_013401888.1 chondroitin sulfate N-acetylgalactosaminyltransferase 2 [Lingula anatina]XP_013401889.1 chondroitin sulfate N-acetylgalactosaminyltransferase 2 [Lingula anatina]XP_013401890.1 chondroitin sulfate N-acetylgalactosaminyltransferase 2 [Lingula anatina]XP_013401891.1 chondroitin sulfate N-acetylgalactosaminyltransferase 2 [Lingula anatina]XP_013401892.1 chondroitin sulfate N-acetylgalactosaminyltransferase 2|eukprot:XP_013401887.1 chondroitin sulfate N-acetylgalactosaminyltransferase 2 [Lingula anatina]
MRITMPRILLLLFLLSMATMMFVARCGINMDKVLLHQNAGVEPSFHDKEHYEALLSQQRLEYERRINSLENQLADLTRTLQQVQSKSRENDRQEVEDEMEAIPIKSSAIDYHKFNAMQLETSELLHGVPYKTEYEMESFNMFTLNRIYLINPGLGRRVVEKPIGYKKKDLFEVLGHAVDSMNARRRAKKDLYSTDHFLQGIYRVDPSVGAHYELYFRDLDNMTSDTSYSKVSIMRPFGPLMTAVTEKIDTAKEMINLILPLSGRIETFRTFLDRFIKLCILIDQRVYLTVVYFGFEGLNDVKSLLNFVTRKYNFSNIKLINLNEKFSRGKGLEVGAKSLTSSDALMFFCDVDVVFSADFLERCRMNTEKGRRVYYPIVFSLYNPKVVYSLHDAPIPKQKDQLIISRDAGFWRDFGYGMTCQYHSDFLKLGGIDEDIKGWGGEDVLLFRKYVKSNYMVVRATDPGIFHLWHEKHCDPNLTSEQYRSCIRSKALNEASHAQLGMLAFKDEVDLHRSYKKKEQAKLNGQL